MGTILYIFYGFVGIAVLLFCFQYIISNGIDNSKSVKALRADLKEIKKQLQDLKEK